MAGMGLPSPQVCPCYFLRVFSPCVFCGRITVVDSNPRNRADKYREVIPKLSQLRQRPLILT